MYSFVTIDGQTVIAGPPGYKVNLDHPTQRQDILAYVLFALSVCLSTFCLVQFAYVKLRVLHKVDAQLVLLILGWLTSMVISSIQVRGYVHKITGVHIYEMSVLKAIQGAKMLVVVSVLNALATGFCKASLGLSYYQISPQRWWKWATGAAVCLISSYNMAILLIALLGCRPIEKNWLPTTPGVCINRPALYIARAACGVVSDLTLLTLPIPMILKLQVPTRQKVAVTLFFAIGAATLITSAVRLYTLQSTLDALDLTWEYSTSGVINLVEVQLVAICASLPTMKQFFAHVSPKLAGEWNISGKSYGSTETGTHEVELRSFKTIGAIANRRRVDEFGMTIGDNDSFRAIIGRQNETGSDNVERGSSTYEGTWTKGGGFGLSKVGGQSDCRSDVATCRTSIYDTSWFEVICEESFNKEFV